MLASSTGFSLDELFHYEVTYVLEHVLYELTGSVKRLLSFQETFGSILSKLPTGWEAPYYTKWSWACDCAPGGLRGRFASVPLILNDGHTPTLVFNELANILVVSVVSQVDQLTFPLGG